MEEDPTDETTLPEELDDLDSGELGFHTVLVTGGKDAVDTWLNREQGLVWIYKKTNTGESVEGWHIAIYSDAECTKEVGTVITNAEGKAGHYLSPGIYYAKETGDELGRFEDEYWMVDETVQKIEILPHQDTEITFTNVQYGKLKIQKTVEGDGGLAGWEFRVTDAHGNAIDGSPFTSGEDGMILTANLLPGEYTVEELLPEDSLYQCKSENPQKITVVQGQTAEVSFINVLRPGTITVKKVDTTGSPLAGATFLLEWSEDGDTWQPVQYSESVTKGGCSAEGLTDGCLTSGEDGILQWAGLHPGLHYRLTETKAPEGFKLLTEAAFTGTLPTDTLSVELTVVNARTFTMPETGAVSGAVVRVLGLTAAIGCLVALIYRKKES